MIQRLLITLKGICMGIADVIPGVSGGTVALILGIYSRLVRAIRLVDLTLVGLLLSPSFYKRCWAHLTGGTKDAMSKEDDHAEAVLFLLFLVSGIAVAVLTGAQVIPGLMARYPEPMRGLFFGLILASVAVPYQMMKSRTLIHGLVFVAVAILTFFLVGLRVDQSRFSHGTVLVQRPSAETAQTLPAQDLRFSATDPAGLHKHDLSFGASADIQMPAGVAQIEVPVVANRSGDDGNVAAGSIGYFLPSKLDSTGWTVTQPKPLSGGADPPLWYIFVCGAIAICAMILPGISGAFLLLVLGQYDYILFNLNQLVSTRSSGAAAIVGIFILGILVGILSFSRVLNWMLYRLPDATMAALVGLMVGSLRVLWPFQTMDSEGSHNRLPTSLTDTITLVTIGAMVLGVVIIVGLTVAGNRHAQATERG